ncbi:MAG: type VI secretion system baseplate subunit TssF [Alphaproteobacteria bacterium]|nr:type VI secretion system baseplate subunit TssF [Alphaproteobacteria bacterium]
MADRLLTYYERELDFIRNLAGEFADAHPQAAEGLRLGPGQSADPHVERLIEAVALLSARVRLKLDDTFPELSDAFVGEVYPHYANPLPPASVVRMELDRQATDSAVVPRGTEIESQPVGGQPVRFTTCFDTALHPVTLAAAELRTGRHDAPAHPNAGQASAVLRLRLRTFDAGVKLAELGIGSLRLHLEGSGQVPGSLYEMLCRCAVGVAVVSRERSGGSVALGREAVRQVGFDDDEALLPPEPRTFPGYRLLTEYFLMPRKFLFVDIDLGAAGSLAGSEWDLFVYLSDVPAGVGQSVGAANFSLGCVPIMNVFDHRCDPVSLSGGVPEIRVEPDRYNLDALEIYDVTAVSLLPPDGGDAVPVAPFYAVGRPDQESGATFYWHAVRRPAPHARGGSDLYMSIVDFAGKAVSLDKWVLTVETRCFNRDMASRLPFGGGQPQLFLTEVAAPIGSVGCRAALEKPVRPELGDARAWNLISQLSLSHLALVGDDTGGQSLREVLALHDFRGSAANRALIDGILSVSSRRVARKVAFPQGVAVCQGLEVTLVFDPPQDAGSSTFLFMAVIERFLSRSASINSFVELVVRIAGSDGEFHRWAPRLGAGHVL